MSRFDLQDSIAKLPGFAWAKYPHEHHIPGYNYLGPGTSLVNRIPGYEVIIETEKLKPGLMSTQFIDSMFTPRDGDGPINKTDKVAMRHDLRYSEAIDLSEKHEADRMMLRELESYEPASFGERISRWIAYKIIKLKEKLGMSLNDDMSAQIAKELHLPVRKHYPRRRIITNYLNEIWSVDLMEMPSVNGYKFVLIAIDNWSKYLFCIPMKSKSAEATADAFTTLFEEADVTPVKMHSDEGKEFKNSTITRLFEKHNIELYSTQNETKSAIAERAIRSLKDIIERKITESEYQNMPKPWLHFIQEAVDLYNNRIHRTIRMTPLEAQKQENQSTLTKIYHELNQKRIRNPDPLEVGTYVRLYKWKNKFTKSSKQRWTTEIFRIKEVLQTNPLTYKIEDEDGEVIEGSFYRQELSPSMFRF